jgi:hypothetical protein
MTDRITYMNNTNTNNNMVGLNADIHDSHLWHVLPEHFVSTCVKCACADDSVARGLPCEGDPDLAS